MSRRAGFWEATALAEAGFPLAGGSGRTKHEAVNAALLAARKVLKGWPKHGALAEVRIGSVTVLRITSTTIV